VAQEIDKFSQSILFRGDEMTRFCDELKRQQAEHDRLARLRLVTPSPVVWCLVIQAALFNVNYN